MNRLAPILLPFCAVVLLWQAARRQPELLQQRRQHHLNWDEPLRNSPPLVSFTTVALGGFRGIIADVLWLRASKLQEERKYFELVQLADWITKLEPRFALVWAFHGWNMAYNISVLLNDPADRWRWVKHGFELLRDEGMFYNPGDPKLHHELGWIFQHKLGGWLDQAHLYYKKAWATEMAQLFPGPRPDFDALLAHPDDPNRVRLERDYKLDVAVMQKVDKEYGPLDWRLPQAHAIYWAYRGKPFASGFEAVQLDRMIFQSMQDAFWQGRLVENNDEGVFVPSPNLEVLPKVRHAYEQAIAANPDQDSMRSGHKNFLKAATLLLYENGALAMAREVFDDMVQRYPTGDLAHGLEAFIQKQFAEQADEMNQQQALGAVEAMFYQSYFWMALGETDRATGLAQLGEILWRRYMATRTEEKLRERMGLPPLPQIKRQAYDRALKEVRSAQGRQRLEEAAPPQGESGAQPRPAG